MLNSFHTDSVVATSEAHYDDVYVSGCRQLPSVAVESVDEHQYNYIDTFTLQTPEGTNPVDVTLQHPPNDVLTVKIHACLRNRYVWSLLVFVLVAAIIIALFLSLSQAESNSVTPILLEFENEDVYVYEGHRSVQWVVNVTASSQPKLVWYGPNCEVLEGRDGPIRLEVYTSATKTVAKLKLYDISVADRGVYRLQASNKEGEEWAYFTLNVTGVTEVIQWSLRVAFCAVCGWRSDLVNVTASSQPKLVWYGPNCEVLEGRDGPIRLEVYTSATKTVAKLKLYDISVADRGVYRLQASNKEGEEWAYFTLNVTGKSPVDRQHVVMCYVPSWAHSRHGLGMFTVDNIDPTLCTHLVYAFAVLNMTKNAIESADPAYDLEENNGTGAYRKMTSLKRHNRQLKLLLGMGGWDEREKKNYSEVAESPSRRKALVTSVSDILRKYNFDGLDLHWQYPVEGNGVPADKENFVSLLKEFREEFDKFGLLLTAPLGVTPDIIEKSYDLPAISKYLHYMFADCFAYYNVLDSLTEPNAPLYPRCEDDNLHVESSINTLLRKGADRNKLVLGLPLFGQIFKLKNPEAGVGFEKESEGAGMEGPYVEESGFWGYIEICLEVDNPTNNWTKYWDNVTHTPYASKGDQFISYDDAMSLTDKVELAVRKMLAGVMVYSLDLDDFHGSCTLGNSVSTGYTLTRAIINALNNSVSLKKVPCHSRSSTACQQSKDQRLLWVH